METSQGIVNILDNANAFPLAGIVGAEVKLESQMIRAEAKLAKDAGQVESLHFVTLSDTIV